MLTDVPVFCAPIVWIVITDHATDQGQIVVSYELRRRIEQDYFAMPVELLAKLDLVEPSRRIFFVESMMLHDHRAAKHQYTIVRVLGMLRNVVIEIVHFV